MTKHSQLTLSEDAINSLYSDQTPAGIALREAGARGAAAFSKELDKQVRAATSELKAQAALETKLRQMFGQLKLKNPRLLLGVRLGCKMTGADAVERNTNR